MKKITRNELVDMLKTIKKSTFASLTYRVDESKSKTIKGVKQLQKEVTVNISLNANYSKKVNKIDTTKQGGKGGFVSQKMNGKEFAFDGCRNIIKNSKGGLMLYCFIENDTPKQTTYFYNNCVIKKEKAIKQGLFTPAFFKPKPTTGRGMVKPEHDFSVISPKIDNIKRIKINKEEFYII